MQVKVILLNAASVRSTDFSLNNWDFPKFFLAALPTLPNLPNLWNTDTWTIYVIKCELRETCVWIVQQLELQVIFLNITFKI